MSRAANRMVAMLARTHHAFQKCQQTPIGVSSMVGVWEGIKIQRLCYQSVLCARGFAAGVDSGGKKMTSGPVNWKSFALFCVTGGGLVAFYDYEKNRRKQAAVPKSVGKAAIGGPFTLVDQSGKKFTDKDLLGQWALLYFGFTHCPDICPDELLKIADAVDGIEQKAGKQVVPVFISIDPERDSVAQVRSYVKEFHPRMLGLTGSKEQTSAAAKAYRVYFTKANETEKDYLIDHSIISYLVDPSGDFVAFYGKNSDAETMVKEISDHIKHWAPQK